MSDKKPSKRFAEITKPKRAALSRERIEVEALSLIDAEGIDAFSTRKLGARLGCEAMSIYHHFPSKAHILDALVDRTLGGMPVPDKSLTPAQRLRAFAQSWRELALQHPRFYLWLSVYQWNSTTGTRFLSEMLACFYDAGLSPERAAYGFRGLGYYVQGVATDESSGYATGPSSLNPVPLDVLERDFPQVAQSRQYFTPDHFDRIFEIGFGALLRELGLE
ncbi:MAG: TetR/AcrR family transcriptional regulator [Casimicrobium sp.]